MDEKNALESTSAADDSTAGTLRKTKTLEFLMFVFFVAKTLSGKIFWVFFGTSPYSQVLAATLKNLGMIQHGSVLVKLGYVFISLHNAFRLR